MIEKIEKHFDKNIVSSTLTTIIVFSFIGFSINYCYKIEMNGDVWFWFFSTIAQVFAALIALVAIFLISRLDLYNEKINHNIQMILSFSKYDWSIADHMDHKSLIRNVDKYLKESEDNLKTNVLKMNRSNISIYEKKKKTAKEQMKKLLQFTIPIIMLSIFLIPIGAPNSNNDIWLWNPTLKWGFIYLIVGLCVSSLFIFYSVLKDLLDEKDE